MSIQRREFLSRAGTCLLSGWMLNVCTEKKRPNILWLIAEDFGPDLGCYGTRAVKTPNIDRLAAEGMRFTNAFTTAPVCSASRSAFMTGMYQTSIGAHNHRSHRDDGYKLPEGVHVITHYFRQAGYFTANVTTAAPGIKGTGKNDFNFNVENPWDGTDWNQRQPGQPFYAQINFSEVHRMGIRPKKLTVNPEDVDIPPYYPDHPVTRKDWAMYLSATEALDLKVGAVLNRLEDEDLADNTIVVFFGDHGRNHVRGKQWLYDGGIHIPLIVRWPGRMKSGIVSDDMISAIDISASSLFWAGIELPSQMEGRVIMGTGAKKRDYIVAARDRCDGTVDRIRCVRSKKFKYIRNFFPEKTYAQHNRYKEIYYPVIRLLRRLNDKGQLTPTQALFMAKSRPSEELYDLQADPHEIKNLAKDSAYRDTLVEMRGQLERWIQESGDQGQYPEPPEMIKNEIKVMMEWKTGELEELYRKEGMLHLFKPDFE